MFYSIEEIKIQCTVKGMARDLAKVRRSNRFEESVRLEGIGRKDINGS